MSGTWRIITDGLGESDPYKSEKQRFNSDMLQIYGLLKSRLSKGEEGFFEALRLSAVGNIIDFGANHYFDKEMCYEKICNLCSRDIFAIDHSRRLYEKLKVSKQLLVIGDNCGEIVLDKLLIERIRSEFSDIKIYFSVRGKAVLNDVTSDDALQVGMGDLAIIIDDGTEAPVTVLPQRRMIQAHFRRIGSRYCQRTGNYEGLSDIKRDGLFFVLMAKCPVISDYIGVPNLKCVCVENNS
uniref:Damage-control phosphatase ARMT1-like metal-binding domain-containing protein n=1 Tax=Peptoclostridium acidaminophilum TaxID=1731 RepID=Q9L3Q3_PEPAC|nr:hypothetical protein OrfB [Peptoclostridium acidaminophilum DSM 3953]